MASKNEDNWLANYEELKAHVIETGHFFNKHNKLCNWAKYQRKRIKAGTMPEEQRMIFEALEKMRSGEHTRGEEDPPNEQFLPIQTSKCQFDLAKGRNIEGK